MAASGSATASGVSGKGTGQRGCPSQADSSSRVDASPLADRKPLLFSFAPLPTHPPPLLEQLPSRLTQEAG